MRIFVVLEIWTRSRILRVEQVTTVGRIHRVVLVLLFITFSGELYPASPIKMIKPHLSRAQGARPGEMLTRDNARAIGMPARVCERAEFLRCNGSLLFGGKIHNEDIVAAIGVANVGK